MSSPKSTLRFSLRGLLALTGVFAVAVMPLAKPWEGWLYAFPFLACLLAVLIVARLITATVTTRVFWSGLLVGPMIFLCSVLCMDLLTQRGMFGNSVWEDAVSDPLFRLVHGTGSFRSTVPGITPDDFRSFKLYVTVDAAVLTSAIGAGGIQFLMNRRLRRANSEGNLG